MLRPGCRLTGLARDCHKDIYEVQPNKLTCSIEEARMTAAQYTCTMTQIGFPVDGSPDVPYTITFPFLLLAGYQGVATAGHSGTC